MPTKVLNEIPVFQGLARKHLDELSEWIRREDYAAGQKILTEGQKSRGLYVLSRGTVRVVKAADGGETEICKLAGPSLFGEMALLTGETHSASIIAEDAAVVGLLPRTLFIQKLNQENVVALRFAYNIAQILCGRLRSATQTICDISAKARLVDGAPEKGTHCPLRDFRDKLIRDNPE